MGVVLLKRKLTSFQIIILGFSGVILFGTFVFAIAGGQETEKYRFFYNAKTLPRKDSYAVDYWGS